jgi:hypothetical protein
MFLLCDNLSFSQSFLMFEPSFLTSLLCNTRHYPMISPIRMSLVNCSFRIVFFLGLGDIPSKFMVTSKPMAWQQGWKQWEKQWGTSRGDQGCWGTTMWDNEWHQRRQGPMRQKRFDNVGLGVGKQHEAPGHVKP